MTVRKAVVEVEKPNLSLLDLRYAYLAGIIDGEGTVRIHRIKASSRLPRGYYCAEISIGSTTKELIDFIHENFYGGAVTYKKPQRVGWKESWEWRVYKNEYTTRILQKTQPFLVVKIKQCELALKFLDYYSNKPSRLTDGDVAVFEEMYDEMSQLNR